MCCTIWYHLHNLKTRKKKTHGGKLLLVKLDCNFTKCNTPPRVFLTLFNCTHGIKSCKASPTQTSY